MSLNRPRENASRNSASASLLSEVPVLGRKQMACSGPAGAEKPTPHHGCRRRKPRSSTGTEPSCETRSPMSMINLLCSRGAGELQKTPANQVDAIACRLLPAQAQRVTFSPTSSEISEHTGSRCASRSQTKRLSAVTAPGEFVNTQADS